MKVKKEEIKQWINDVYTKLWDLLSLYEETDGFLTVPEGEMEVEPRDFVSRKIGEIRRIAENFSLYMDEQEIAEFKKLKPRWAAVDPGLLRIDPEVEKVFGKMHQIVNDTACFIAHCIQLRGVGGPVFLWQALNPHLTYFDGVFDLMEQYPETYREMGIQGGKFVHIGDQTCESGDKIYFPCEFPGTKLIAERNAYFEKIKEQNRRENLNWSKERTFQEELLKTLWLLFERDFKEYL